VAAVERKYFSVLFRRETGWRLFDYVRARRLARAAELLTERSVTGVAEAVGCHVRTLERSFTRQTGSSPAAYRRGAAGANGIVADQQLVNCARTT
jgi:transcriptional regulator GlxA family with amidase domain